MDNRLALLYDRSASFNGRLQRILKELGCKSRIVTSRKALLQSVKTDQPSIVFIAVELPRKAGFSLFSDVKLVSRQVQVVLITGSVLPEEMRIHQTLQVHAEAYLDKRSMDSLDLFTTLNHLLRLDLSDAELERLARKSRLFPPGNSSSEEDSLELEIEQSISFGGSDGDGSTQPAAPSGAFDEDFIQRPAEVGNSGNPEEIPGASDAEKNRALTSEMELLRQELEEMRCAVSSTPFSEEYRVLKARAGKAEDEAKMLRDQLTRHAQHVHELESKLVDAEFQLRSLQDGEAMAQEQVRSLEQQVAQSVQERVSAEHEWARSLERLKDHSEKEKADAASSAAQAVRRELEEFQREQSTAVESAKRHSRSAVEDAVKANEASWQVKMAGLADEHAKALAAQSAEHQQESSRLISEQARKVLDKENELRETLARASASHEEELAAKDTHWEEHLAEVRKEFETGRSADCAALEARYRKELQMLRGQHIKERERLQTMHTEGLENLSAKMRQTIQDPEKIKNPLLRSKVEEKLKERETELTAQKEGAVQKG